MRGAWSPAAASAPGAGRGRFRGRFRVRGRDPSGVAGDPAAGRVAFGRGFGGVMMKDRIIRYADMHPGALGFRGWLACYLEELTPAAGLADGLELPDVLDMLEEKQVFEIIDRIRKEEK